LTAAARTAATRDSLWGRRLSHAQPRRCVDRTHGRKGRSSVPTPRVWVAILVMPARRASPLRIIWNDHRALLPQRVILRPNRTLSRCTSIGLVLLQELTFWLSASNVGARGSCTFSCPHRESVQAVTLSTSPISKLRAAEAALSDKIKRTLSRSRIAVSISSRILPRSACRAERTNSARRCSANRRGCGWRSRGPWTSS
jgi:hypothetical protein